MLPRRPNLPALAVLTAFFPALAAAQEEAVARPFELGAVTVTATVPQIGEIGEDQVASVVTRKEMRQFNRDNVGDALNLLSGVTVSNMQKNEKRIYVRGFDSRQVGLFIDGIPVYIPYDGLVDLNRFTTADLAAVQVAKGFSSVAYGPNTLGGAINLISRKPRVRLEGDASIGFGEGNERQASVNVGTNQGLWYLQAGASYIESDNFRLSSDFRPTATENGGARNNSYRKDDKLSFKFGLTPNATDEYTLSYYKQNGEKGQPPSTNPASARYWQWPYWDKESLYFISRTALGQSETLKIRLYIDKYDNALDMFTDATYTTRSSNGTGPSVYDDETKGGSVELESTRFASQTLRLVAHYKEDQHDKFDRSRATIAVEDFNDKLVSWAIEDNIQIGPNLMLSLGAARHQLRPDTLYDSTKPGLTLPGKKTANDAQAGLFYDWSAAVRLYATVARKTRLPTLSDRYSQSMNTYIENPDLQPEESVNYEIGYQGTPWAGAKAEAALFYSDIDDKIQTWYSSGASCTAANKCQRRNIGKVRSKGIELGLRSPLSSRLELGGNYTYIDLENVSDPATRVTDVPRHKIILHALFRPVSSVDLVAFAERDSSKWVSNTVRLDGFTTLNLKAVWRPAKNISGEAGVNNATDKNYELADGFPNPGRMWFANATYTF
ncbi:TonB-dependent receptor [Pseudothauera rhizosphaerae]|uniref:TonB-dependent receptor n=2 Tax=Pseudothauera rhizosphaerae TaxID=2565932 RepID=A0A4S4ASP7_9RHOO|nr:TonB-dependent receptor [Pseudothauera rhizosphaerae]